MLIAAVLLCGSSAVGLSAARGGSDACGREEIICCCGIRGGCGMCASEQEKTPSRDLVHVVPAIQTCSGPERAALSPVSGLEGVVTAWITAFHVFPLVEFLDQELVRLPASRTFSPDPPPPRLNRA